jgi:hypothetical protein
LAAEADSIDKMLVVARASATSERRRVLVMDVTPIVRPRACLSSYAARPEW